MEFTFKVKAVHIDGHENKSTESNVLNQNNCSCVNKLVISTLIVYKYILYCLDSGITVTSSLTFHRYSININISKALKETDWQHKQNENCRNFVLWGIFVVNGCVYWLDSCGLLLAVDNMTCFIRNHELYGLHEYLNDVNRSNVLTKEIVTSQLLPNLPVNHKGPILHCQIYNLIAKI